MFAASKRQGTMPSSSAKMLDKGKKISKKKKEKISMRLRESLKSFI